eukprot:404476-Rhodomonas_salina.1
MEMSAVGTSTATTCRTSSTTMGMASLDLPMLDAMRVVLIIQHPCAMECLCPDDLIRVSDRV